MGKHEKLGGEEVPKVNKKPDFDVEEKLLNVSSRAQEEAEFEERRSKQAEADGAEADELFADLYSDASLEEIGRNVDAVEEGRKLAPKLFKELKGLLRDGIMISQVKVGEEIITIHLSADSVEVSSDSRTLLDTDLNRISDDLSNAELTGVKTILDFFTNGKVEVLARDRSMD